MGLFDQKLSGRRATTASPQQLRIRAVKPADVPELVEMEKLCYQQLQKGEDGKFLIPFKAAAVVDPDFDIEIIPVFCMQQAGFEKMLTGIGRELRMQVAVKGEKVVGAVGFEVKASESIIDIFSLLIHPSAHLGILEKFIVYFESLAEHSLNEVNVVYDLPDALDTPMQRVFTHLRDSGWNYVLKRNTYGWKPRNVDSWQFKRTFGANKSRKREVKEA